MPRLVPQALKSLNTIKMQPDRLSSKMEIVLCMDLAGRTGKAIAQELGIGESRVSIIRNSPLYVTRLAQMRDELKGQFVEKQADKIVAGDPVEAVLKSAAVEAARKKVALMSSSANEFVASAAAGDILDRAGYRAHQEKTKVTVEVTDRMADRWEKALRYEPNNNVGKTKVRVTQEVSE